MNPFEYKNGADFLKKTGMSIDEALIFLDHEIRMRTERGEARDRPT